MADLTEIAPKTEGGGAVDICCGFAKTFNLRWWNSSTLDEVTDTWVVFKKEPFVETRHVQPFVEDSNNFWLGESGGGIWAT